MKITSALSQKDRDAMVKKLFDGTKETLKQHRVSEESLSNHRVVKILNNQFESGKRLNILNEEADLLKHHQTMKA